MGCKVLGKMVPIIVLPYWSVVLPTALLTVLPIVPWSTRFSLRTLLIATTLAAVLLGLSVYMVG